jgi:hypothetical protein
MDLLVFSGGKAAGFFIEDKALARLELSSFGACSVGSFFFMEDKALARLELSSAGVADTCGADSFLLSIDFKAAARLLPSSFGAAS